MNTYRIGDAASLLGVSTDTVRRWIDSGRLAARRDAQGHRVIEGEALAGFARAAAEGDARADPEALGWSSARNRFRGIVTDVRKDTVMAQVEIQAGPYRVVSLMSAEAADELGLRVGVPATAVVKSTNVLVERAEGTRGQPSG